MTTGGDVGKSKAALARGWVASKDLVVTPHPVSWDDFMSNRIGDWKIDCVATALDSAEARIGVQASLPMWIVNGWTQQSEMGVSRHEFLGKNACLACLYLPTGAVPSEADNVASALGLIGDLLEVRRRLQLSVPTERVFLQKIAEINKIELDQILEFEGKPLRELYTKGVCGGTILSLKNGESDARAEVPMPFQSALAGILMMAEIVIRATGARTTDVPTITRIDLLKKMGSQISNKRMKKDDMRCLCQDNDFIEVYKDKYNVA